MQITIDLPDHLADKLQTLPDPRRFIVDLLTDSLEGGLDADQWCTLLEGIDDIATSTGVVDLAERHDHYLGSLP
jgi:hypothetical protein